MTSPSKRIDVEADNTMFGRLSNIEKQTITLNKQMAEQLQIINRLKNQLAGLQRQGKQTSTQTKLKLQQQIKKFQQRIKNFLISQKAEYMRLSNQINSMIQYGKQINSQLTLLATKFDEFQKNVGT